MPQRIGKAFHHNPSFALPCLLPSQEGRKGLETSFFVAFFFKTKSKKPFVT